MEEMVSAGFQAPQGTVFAEYDFAADDKSLSVDAILGMCGATVNMRDYLESFAGPVGPLAEDEFSRFCEERFAMEMPKEMRDSMLGGYLYAPMTDEEKAAMEAMSAEFIEAWASEAGSETKCAAFLAACDPSPFEAGEMLAAMEEAALGLLRPVLFEQFDMARRLLHTVRRNIALKRFTLKPVAFPLDWLDLVVRRRRRMGVKTTALDRLFSLSSCGGWTS